MIFVKKVKTS